MLLLGLARWRHQPQPLTALHVLEPHPAADTAVMLKLSVNLPMADTSIDNVRRAEVYATVLLPD